MASLTQGTGSQVPYKQRFWSEQLKEAWKGAKPFYGKHFKRFKDVFFSGAGHEKGMEWVKMTLGLPEAVPKSLTGSARELAKKAAWRKGLAGRALGLGFTLYGAYEGYQQGGIGGAVKSVVQSTAESYLMGRALHLGSWMLRGTMSKVALPAVAAGLGVAALSSVASGQGFGQAFRPLARRALHEHMRKHAKLEMGTPVADDFGTVATMRQRSLQAIQESKINGRSALGNEALLMYQPYFR